MKDEHKTKKELIAELGQLREQISECRSFEKNYVNLKDHFNTKKPKDKHIDFCQEYKELLKFVLWGSGLKIWEWGVRQGISHFSTSLNGQEILKKEEFYLTWEKLVHPDDLPEVIEKFDSYFRGERTIYEAEHRIMSNLGEWKWVISKGKFVEWDKNRFPLKMMGVYLDITERKHTETRLKESKEKYKTLTNNINVGIFRALNIPKGRLIEMNRTFVEMFGYQSREELLGLNLSTLCKRIEDRSRIRKKITHEGVLKKEEIYFKRKNGEILIGAVTGVAIRDRSGEIMNFDGIVEDISERNKEKEDLREKEKMYRTLVETSPDAITVASLKGKIIMTNHRSALMNGFRSTEEMIREVDDIFHLMVLDGVQIDDHSIRKLFKISVSIHIEHDQIRKDGSIYPAETRASLIPGKTNVRKLVVLITSDITERIKAEKKSKIQQEQLIQADKMVALGTLVSGVAHEINNPTNFVMLNIPMLQKAWKNIIPILDEYYEKNGDFFMGHRLKYSRLRNFIPSLFAGILDGAKRIKSIVEELKDFSRQESSDLFKEININEVVSAAISLISNIIKKSTRNFSVQYGKGIPLIMGNFQRFEQVIINLIENSCQALTDNEKGIFVTTRFNKEANLVVIRVKDEGIGMDDETMSKILDPFFTTKRHIKGTGLGLSVSSNIIKNHDGFINFDSNPGKGTVATVLLPLVKNRNPKKKK
jgi:PAS domain S-box-containing protein